MKTRSKWILSMAALSAGIFSFGAATPAQALCFVNESPRNASILVHGAKYRIGRGRIGMHTWAIRLPTGYRVCCPKGEAACRHPNPLVVVRIDFAPVDRSKLPKANIVAKLPWIRVPIAPTSVAAGPRIDPLCGWSFRAPRDGTVQIYGRMRREGNRRLMEAACEVWSAKSRLLLVSKAPYKNNRLPVRSHLFACNYSKQPSLHIVYALYTGPKKGWSTMGYRAVKRGTCLRLAMPSDYYRAKGFFHAIDNTKRWGGRDAFFCIDPRKHFGLTRADRPQCPAGMGKVGFFMRQIGAGANHITFVDRK